MKFSIFAAIGGIFAALSCQAQDEVNKPAPPAAVSDVLASVDLRRVKVGGELGRRIDLTVSGNLLQIDVDKDFLAPFKGGKYAGPDGGSAPFIGVGKTLDGMVWLAANTGNPALVARKDHVARELIATQGSDGYIGLLSPEKRTWTLWDLHEQAFIIKALVSDYHFFGNKSSLEAARRLADYVVTRWAGKPVDWEKSLPIKEFMAEIGLSASFLSLYEATGNSHYVDFAANELGDATWNTPIVIGRHPPIEGHAYTYLGHCLAQLELYRLRPSEALLAPTRRAVDFMTDADGMAITGSVGQDECWTNDQKGTGNLGETCSTAYQIFVFDSLLRLEGNSRWGDLIERNLYNAGFGAQSPDGRRLRYYTPFEGKRVYFEYDTYCCPGNFRRLMGFVPQLIYYRFGKGVAINLYSASEVTLDGIGGTRVALRQETDYPKTGQVTVRVEPREQATFPLLLRIPRWSAEARVSVDGKPWATTAKAGEFLRIERTWQRGDRVTLNLAMPWRFVAGRKAQAGCSAVMRGPLVYTLDPAKNPALSAADLKRVVLLPQTAELVKDDPAVRTGETACKIKADLDRAGRGALSLLLTEFADPDGQAIYFQLADPKASADDELLGARQFGGVLQRSQPLTRD